MKRTRGVPPLVSPGSPIMIDGMSASLSRLNGTFYTEDIRGMMRNLRTWGVDFHVSGSPIKGIRSIKSKDFEILDPFKAWLFDKNEVSIDELYNELSGFESLLDDKFRPTAAKTFIKLVGRIPWVDKGIVPYARAAFSGGIQWSRPGVYLDTTTSDMREAYFWAMHKCPLPKHWRFINSISSVSPLSIIHATITTNGRNGLPLLPFNAGGFTSRVHFGSNVKSTGYWFGCDIMAAEDYIEKMEVHGAAVSGPTYILNRRVDLEQFEKPLRKRLALVGYGIHAQNDTSYVGEYCSSFYEACSKFGTHRIRQTHHDSETGAAIWWKSKQEERPYVRIDWGGTVTSRVRYRILKEGFAIMRAGGRVARIYVDSLTATKNVLCGYGNRPGTFKIDNEGVAIIGPPGIGLIGGEIKHSGVPIEQALRVIESVKRGTYDARDTNWTGLLEDLG